MKKNNLKRDSTRKCLISVWSDIRTDAIVDQIIAKFPDQSKNHLKPLCGLPVSPYFSALKIRWLKDNLPSVRKAIRERRCKVGTMDTWIVWVCETKRYYNDMLVEMNRYGSNRAYLIIILTSANV